MLSGNRIFGHIKTSQGGHALTNKLLIKFLSDKSNWILESTEKLNKDNDQLKASILQAIANHINTGLPAIEEMKNEDNDLKNIIFDEDDYDVVSKINSILLSKIRPAVMQDGGDVNFVKYKSGVVYLSLKGSCAGCPSATITLKNGIENMLKHNIPEVKKVEQIL